jgi:hypothetical protein
VAEPEPIRWRVLKIVHGILAATPGVTRVRVGWQPWTDCRPEMLPALYIIALAGGEHRDMPALRVREMMLLRIYGYDRPAPADLIPGLCDDGVAVARERLLQKVRDRLGSAAMDDALRADVAAHNDGAVFVRPTAGPEVDDINYPYAIFALPCEALIHRPRCVS